MTPRKRSLTAWLRIVHRWISMGFIALAAYLILQTVLTGVSDPTVSTVAIVLLVLLIVTGTWMAVHHYIVKLRRRGSARPRPVAGV